MPRKPTYRGLSERRRSRRLAPADLYSYYWDGAVPAPRAVREISADGAVIEAPDRWYAGTVMHWVLQRAAAPGDAPAGAACFGVWARVVRDVKPGVAVEFLHANRRARREFRRFLNGAPRAERGQALVEFALVLPLLFLLIVNVVNFGGMLSAWIAVSNAARSGAQQLIMGGSYVQTPTRATAAQVQAQVARDLAGLPNAASLRVAVCTNDNGAVTCAGSGAGAPQADPEAPYYVLGRIDVTYTYQPLIPLWSFPALHIYATLPPTTIHRQASMRME